jgi:hypothetical protein
LDFKCDENDLMTEMPVRKSPPLHKPQGWGTREG